MKQLTPLDVEEFFVLIYEYWKRITTVTIYARSYFVWCRSFYDFYKDQSLFEVLSAIGLSKLTYKLKLYVLSKSYGCL